MERRPTVSGPAKVLLRRLLQAALVALLIGTLSFFLMRALPGDIAFRVAAGRYGPDGVTTAAAEAVRAELGLDRPALAALAEWWDRLLRFDLGVSFINGKPVYQQLAYQLGYTVELALASVLLSAVIGLPLGVLASLRPGSLLDRTMLAVSVVLRSVPAFLLGIGLVIGLSIHLRWLPAAGYAEPRNLILPALTLALALAATTSRVARDTMVAVQATPYFAFARTKGLSDGEALVRHAFRNAAAPVVAYLGVQLAFLIEGVVVVEVLFAWPGLGHALVHAIFGRDVPIVQGVVLLLSMAFIALNTLVDLAVLAIDPRGRDR
jgi:peptide/nickel transport system permease protein